MRFLAAASLIALLGSAAPAAAQTAICSCPGGGSRSAQEGPAICSVVEAEGQCSVAALQFGPETSYQQIAPRIRNVDAMRLLLGTIDITADPVDTLVHVAETPPETWTEDEFVTNLIVLFTLSQAQQGSGDALFDIREALRFAAWEIMPPFTDPTRLQNVETVEVGDFGVRVSYGCVEMLNPDVYVQARVPSSEAVNRCSDF